MALSRTLISMLKWLVVVVATAVVVISIQVSADNQGKDKSLNLSSAAPSVENAVKQQPWSPAAGFADLIEQVSPAVVHVAISGTVKRSSRSPQFNFPPGSPFEEFFEQFKNQQPKQRDEKPKPLGIGSGFIISSDGFVVTNNHVVKDADEIVVTLEGDKEYEAELIGTDSKTDLALLKLKDAKNLPYVAWGDDEKSRVGDWVLAIGNPFGLGGTATTGIISARGRDIRSGPYDDYIQVDAAINRGNSGGPLFNLNGEVIGINTAIYSPNGGSVGIGFSIPANMAKNVIKQLRETGSVARGWIGVEIRPLTEELAKGFNRPNEEGALINSVVPDAPAAKAGLKAGDIILSFDGQKITDTRDLPKVVANAEIDQSHKLEYWRNGKKQSVKIVTEAFPEDPNMVAAKTKKNDSVTSKSSTSDLVGATLVTITDSIRKQYRIGDDVNGVLVLETKAGGLAAQNGVRRGDVITSVDSKDVSEPKQVIDIIEKAKGADREFIVMLLQNNKNNRFVAFKLKDD